MWRKKPTITKLNIHSQKMRTERRYIIPYDGNYWRKLLLFPSYHYFMDATRSDCHVLRWKDLTKKIYMIYLITHPWWSRTYKCNERCELVFHTRFAMITWQKKCHKLNLTKTLIDAAMLLVMIFKILCVHTKKCPLSSQKL